MLLLPLLPFTGNGIIVDVACIAILLLCCCCFVFDLSAIISFTSKNKMSILLNPTDSERERGSTEDRKCYSKVNEGRKKER